MSELRNHVLRTIEIRNPQNFFAALNLSAGDYVFLTPASAEDIRGGTPGIIARVTRHQIATHRMVHGTTNFYEEREMIMARLQLEAMGMARIRKVLANGIGEVTRVDAEEISCYEAR